MSSRAWREDVDSRTNVYVRTHMRHFPLLRATYLEQWWPSLGETSLPAFFSQLSAEQRDALLSASWRRAQGLPPPPREELEELVEILERLVLAAQNLAPCGAAFVRLGSCAPLDSPLAQESDLQVDGGPEALEVLLESERVFDDLCLAQECSYQPSLVVRPWLELDVFRATYQEGELVELTPPQEGVQVPESLHKLAQSLVERIPTACGGELLTQLIEVERPLLLDLNPLLPVDLTARAR